MSGSQTISFNEIPAGGNWLVPGAFVEIRANYNNVGILPIPTRILVVGQMTSGGTATANTLYQNLTRAADGARLGGPGSQIDGMVAAVLSCVNGIPVDVFAMADAGGSTAAAWTLTFTGPATGNGTPAVAIGGTRVYVGTASGDFASATATAFAAAINAITSLPVTAAVSGAVVTVTAKNKGLAGNDISFVVSPAQGDALPAGIGLAIASTVTGATNPNIATAISGVTGLWYSDIIIPWQDSANLIALNTELVRRYGALVHQDGRAYFPQTGSFGTQISSSAAVNGRFMFPATMTAPGTPPWVFAALLGGSCAQKLTDDPARQLLDLVLPGMVGTERANLADDNEKELLLAAGCSVFKVRADKSVLIQRVVSTYTTDSNGNLDPAWRDIMRVATWSRIRYDWRAYFQAIYPRAKLALDSSIAAERDPTVCTPRRAKGSWAARHQLYAANGWVQNEIANIRAATFVINGNDINRLDYVLPMTPMGNLMVDAGQIAFDA